MGTYASVDLGQRSATLSLGACDIDEDFSSSMFNTRDVFETLRVFLDKPAPWVCREREITTLIDILCEVIDERVRIRSSWVGEHRHVVSDVEAQRLDWDRAK